MNKYDPTVPFQNRQAVYADSKEANIEVTELSNGFSVLTESQVFPSTVNMGFLINVGARDETEETSGACLALKNTYLKTLKHTNETINYGMIQMSGGDMQMNYDQESMYFKGHCIEYDTIDMFQMMVDIALEPRSVLAANVAKSKNAKTHDLANHMAKFDPSSRDAELLLTTAYGYNTLGMPLIGTSSNIGNIDARMIQQFIMDNITPKKCLVVASGVKDHKEYVELVKERLGELLAVPEHDYVRQPASYIGGEYRTWTESPQTSIQVAFESAAWGHEDVATLQVMQELLGSAHAFSAGNSGRALEAVRNNGFLDGLSGINSNFTDSGLFGVKVTGAGSHSQDLLAVAIDSLDGLRQAVDETELARAKNALKMNFLLSMENSGDRLEEVARNYVVGAPALDKQLAAIEAVSSHQINDCARRLLAGKPTMVVTGGAINLVPSMTDVQRQLQ